MACSECSWAQGLSDPHLRCPSCYGLLEVKLGLEGLKEGLERRQLRRRPLGVWRYKELLPVDASKAVSLGEGGTRLHHCERLGEDLGLRRLYIKTEGDNPTASFKDRGMTVGVTRALEMGAKYTLCASTGNTSASLAAYSARAGLICTVLVPQGAIAYGKLAQAIAHGARIIEIRGNFDKALELVLSLSQEISTAYLLNSVNPFRIEGQKTLGYELLDQLRRIDLLVLPVGNAGNISAVWKGLTEYREMGWCEELPRLIAVQAEGAAPIADAVSKGSHEVRPIERPRTIASAIRIGAPVSWRRALKAIYSSHGRALKVSDEEILEAQRLLARREGLFVEPASATPIAAVKRMVEEGEVDRYDVIVCIATGHGLKDPEVILKGWGRPLEMEPSLKELKRLFEPSPP